MITSGKPPLLFKVLGIAGCARWDSQRYWRMSSPKAYSLSSFFASSTVVCARALWIFVCTCERLNDPMESRSEIANPGFGNPRFHRSPTPTLPNPRPYPAPKTCPCGSLRNTMHSHTFPNKGGGGSLGGLRGCLGGAGRAVGHLWELGVPSQFPNLAFRNLSYMTPSMYSGSHALHELQTSRFAALLSWLHNHHPRLATATCMACFALNSPNCIDVSQTVQPIVWIDAAAVADALQWQQLIVWGQGTITMTPPHYDMMQERKGYIPRLPEPARTEVLFMWYGAN